MFRYTNVRQNNNYMYFTLRYFDCLTTLNLLLRHLQKEERSIKWKIHYFILNFQRMFDSWKIVLLTYGNFGVCNCDEHQLSVR